MILIGRGLDLGSESKLWKRKRARTKRKQEGERKRAGSASEASARDEKIDESPTQGQRLTCAVLKVRKRAQGAKPSESEARAKRALAKHNISGDNSLRDPPVPIPNTEVKPQHADGTWRATARKSRSSPESHADVHLNVRFSHGDVHSSSPLFVLKSLLPKFGSGKAAIRALRKLEFGI